MKKFWFAFLIFVSTFGLSMAEEKGVNIYEEPRDIPSRPIYSYTGKKVNLTEFEGNFLIVVFWSRYCGPCLRELDNLWNYQQIVANDGIKVILVSPDTEWNNVDEMKKMLKKYHAGDLEAYTDINGQLASDFGIFTSPNTVLINKDSKEIGRLRGSAEWDDEKVVEYIYKIKAERN